MLSLMFKPRPKTIDLAAHDALAEKIERYKKLSEEAGVMTAPVKALPDRGLLEAVKSMGLQKYDLAKVDRYLNLIKPRDTYIVWKTITPEMAFRFREYRRVVPGDALLVVKTLKEKMPGELVFFVSDYEAVAPDPFLAVALIKECKGNSTDPNSLGSFMVIYHWDEPGFGRI